jgi:hypothetical protein
MINIHRNDVAQLGQADHRMRDAIDLVWRALNKVSNENDIGTVEAKCQQMLERCFENFKQDLVTLNEEH